MYNKYSKTSLRVIFIAVVFAIISIVYVVRMINVIVNAEPHQEYVYTYERRVPIQAVRGEIYDRNGKKLIYNKYTYDLIFDYDAMAASQLDRNYAILQAVYALQSTDNLDKRTESSFPFDNKYPNYTYSVSAKDTSSNLYYRLLKRIAENELESDGEVPKNSLTASYLEQFYQKNPSLFPTEAEIVDFYLQKYKLNSTASDGTPLFTDSEIDLILRVRYDMEVADFSIYNRYVMAKDVDLSFISYVKELCIVGADFSVEVEREYAYPEYAAHILGRTGKIPAEKWDYYSSLGYEMNDTVGISGCEYAFEEYLRGEDGVRVIVEDKNGNIVDSRVEKEAVSGKDIYLTIDIDLQIAAEDGLELSVKALSKATAGAFTAIDPNNGEILALASYPSYNIASFNENYSALVSDPANPLYNRALDGLYAPGSTFKIGMVAAGITNGTVSSSTKINCSGRYTYYSDYQPKCWIYPGQHGSINSTQALTVSCNCYFYELGRLMGIDKMNQYCESYGLGQSTGIELGEKLGILAGPSYREEHGLDPWSAGNTISAAIGQSDNNFTPLQLSVYVSTVLNGGSRYSAHLLREVREYGQDAPIYFNEGSLLSKIYLSHEAISSVKEGMKTMVEQSSYVSNQMKNLPVTVGGKTGTAQLGGSETENGIFVCAAPYDNPEIVISSVVEHAGGGSYAAIAAAQVLEEYYSD